MQQAGITLWPSPQWQLGSQLTNYHGHGQACSWNQECCMGAASPSAAAPGVSAGLQPRRVSSSFKIRYGAPLIDSNLLA